MDGNEGTTVGQQMDKRLSGEIKFRVRPEHKALLQRIAVVRDTDLSDVGREAVRFYLEHPDSPARQFLPHAHFQRDLEHAL